MTGLARYLGNPIPSVGIGYGTIVKVARLIHPGLAVVHSTHNGCTYSTHVRAELLQEAPRPAGCSCAYNTDGTTTTMMCPLHADTDPCATVAQVTGRRRKGTIRRGTCTACHWKGQTR